MKKKTSTGPVWKGEDWRILLTNNAQPSAELEQVKDDGVLSTHPELLALVGCEQDPIWHPEGDVWAHTLLSLDCFAKERSGDVLEDYIVGLAVLCHDLGKPATTQVLDGRIVSRRHEAEGEVPTRSFLARIAVAPLDIEAVIPLVLNHMRPEQLYKAKSSDSAVMRLAKRVNNRIDRLIRVARADKGGRGATGKLDFPAGDWVLEKHRRAIPTLSVKVL